MAWGMMEWTLATSKYLNIGLRILYERTDAQIIGYAFGDIGHGGVLKVENNVEYLPVFSCRIQ